MNDDQLNIEIERDITALAQLLYDIYVEQKKQVKTEEHLS